MLIALVIFVSGCVTTPVDQNDTNAPGANATLTGNPLGSVFEDANNPSAGSPPEMPELFS